MRLSLQIPQTVIEDAEQGACRLGISLNEFCARALKSFLLWNDDLTTAQLNEVYSEQPAELDAVLTQMQFASLRYSSWRS